VRRVCGDKVSLLATDEHHGYAQLGTTYPHGRVKHSAKRYVVGAIHTNTIEGFWSLFKRSIVGSYHKVSAKYCLSTSLRPSSSITIARTPTFSGRRAGL
jgi:hypothetical protein